MIRILNLAQLDTTTTDTGADSGSVISIGCGNAN